MCGIVSIISKRAGGFWGADLDLFEGLLTLDTLRGLDSTGVFCVDAARQVGYLKVASHPFHLFALGEYPKWRNRAVSSGRILVGHNRKATQGSINSRNAHPFHSGNIIMVHNGTLRGDHKKDYAPVDVDSHALTIAFDEKGAENVIPTINGAFALIWWDIEKQRLFAVRNDERPLEIVETDDNYFIVSESWMVLQLLARQHKKVTDVHTVAPGKLYEFSIGGNHTITDIEVQKDYYSSFSTTHTGRNRQSANVGKSETTSAQSSQGTQTGAGSMRVSRTPTTTSPSADQSSKTPTTALTLVKNPTESQQQSGADQTASSSAPAERTNPLPVDMANHVPCDEFTRGQSILIKLYEMKLEAGGTLYLCRGKVSEPNTPEIDVVAYLKVSDIVDGDQPKYVNGLVEGTVFKHTTSLCGRSLYVNKIRLPEFVQVHNNRITETEWNYVTTYCKCSQCDSRIHEEDQAYTGIFKRPKNQYTVTCADCIETNLKGDTKHEFTQNRLASLQSQLGERDSLAGSTVRGIEAGTPPTVH